MIMDRQFLEFWGSIFLNAAKGQKQIEDFAKWLSGDFSGFDDFSDMFSKFYGLDILTKNTPEYFDVWSNATQDFYKSFKEFLSLMDLVSRQDYLDLVKENEDLRKQLEEKEEAIDQLRGVLDTKVGQKDKGLGVFEDLIKDQSAQFQELMSSFTRLFNDTSAASVGEKETAPAVKKDTHAKPTKTRPKERTSSGKKAAIRKTTKPAVKQK
jgi:hypothetical protein